MGSRFHERMASSAVNQMNSVVSWAERRVIQLVKTGAIAVGSVAFFYFLIIWTVLMYLFLYWLLIPRPISFETPLNFDFDVDRDGPPASLDSSRKDPFEFPVARVYFPSYDQQWQMEVFEQFSNITTHRKVFPGLHDNPIVFAEVYDVTLTMVLPETKWNSEIGNFMVETELIHANKSGGDAIILARSRRPLAVPHRSWISTMFNDIFFLPFRFVFGWWEAENTISAIVMEGWIEETDYRRVPNAVRVTLSDPRLTIRKSNIRFDVRLWGIRYFMYYWFWTTFVLLVALGVTMQSGLTVSALIAKFIGPSVKKRVKFNLSIPDIFGREEDEDEYEDEEEEDEEEQEEEEEEVTIGGTEADEGEEEEEEVEEEAETRQQQPLGQEAKSSELQEKEQTTAKLFPSMARPTRGKPPPPPPPPPLPSSSVKSEETSPAVIEKEVHIEDVPPSSETTTQHQKVSLEETIQVASEVVVRVIDQPEQAPTGSESPDSEASARSGRMSSDLDVVLVEAPDGASPRQELPPAL